MLKPYRRLTEKEIDAELKRRTSKEEKVDYVRWLIKEEENARELQEHEGAIEEESDARFFYPRYIYFDKDGNRHIGVDGPDPNEVRTQEWRTVAYQSLLQGKLNYWQEALSDNGPFLASSEAACSENTAQKCMAQIPWYGSQESFTNWIALSYEAWMGKYPPNQKRIIPFKQVSELLTPLFYNANSGKTFNPKTVTAHKSDAVSGEDINKGIIAESKKSAT